MPQLPTGTVTFLFTDIEGSTRLLSEAGHAYRTLLVDHRRLIREAVVRHGGVIFGTGATDLGVRSPKLDCTVVGIDRWLIPLCGQHAAKAEPAVLNAIRLRGDRSQTATPAKRLKPA